MSHQGPARNHASKLEPLDQFFQIIRKNIESSEEIPQKLADCGLDESLKENTDNIIQAILKKIEGVNLKEIERLLDDFLKTSTLAQCREIFVSFQSTSYVLQAIHSSLNEHAQDNEELTQSAFLVYKKMFYSLIKTIDVLLRLPNASEAKPHLDILIPFYAWHLELMNGFMSTTEKKSKAYEARCQTELMIHYAYYHLRAVELNRAAPPTKQAQQTQASDIRESVQSLLRYLAHYQQYKPNYPEISGILDSHPLPFNIQVVDGPVDSFESDKPSEEDLIILASALDAIEPPLDDPATHASEAAQPSSAPPDNHDKKEKQDEDEVETLRRALESIKVNTRKSTTLFAEKLRAVREENSALTGKVQILEAQIKAIELKIQSKERALEVEKKTTQDLEKDIITLKSQLDTHKQGHEKSQVKVLRLREEVQRLQAKLRVQKALKASNDQRERQVSTLQEKVRSLTEEKMAADQKHATLELELKRAQAKIHQQQIELQDAHRQAEQAVHLKSHQQDLQQQVKALKVEIQSIKAQKSQEQTIKEQALYQACEDLQCEVDELKFMAERRLERENAFCEAYACTQQDVEILEKMLDEVHLEAEAERLALESECRVTRQALAASRALAKEQEVYVRTMQSALHQTLTREQRFAGAPPPRPAVFVPAYAQTQSQSQYQRGEGLPFPSEPELESSTTTPRI